jgi:hypothetical protein
MIRQVQTDSWFMVVNSPAIRQRHRHSVDGNLKARDHRVSEVVVMDRTALLLNQLIAAVFLCNFCCAGLAIHFLLQWIWQGSMEGHLYRLGPIELLDYAFLSAGATVVLSLGLAVMLKSIQLLSKRLTETAYSRMQPRTRW